MSNERIGFHLGRVPTTPLHPSITTLNLAKFDTFKVNPECEKAMKEIHFENRQKLPSWNEVFCMN